MLNRRGASRYRAAMLVAGLVWPGVGGAAEAGLQVTGAWTPAAANAADTPLLMSVVNGGGADALLRTRCPAAQFSEMHMVDHGEGFPAMRAVKSLPIGPATTTALTPDGAHVMLLQTTHALTVGETFTCTLTFRDAGARTVVVTVGAPAPQAGL